MQPVKHKSIIWAFICAIAVSCAQSAVADVRPGRGPLLGYITPEGIWASTDANPGDARFEIYQGTFGSNALQHYTGNTFKRFDFPYRWRIAHGQFWENSTNVTRTARIERIPLSDLDLYAEFDEKKRTEGVKKRYPDDANLQQHSLNNKPTRILLLRSIIKSIRSTLTVLLRRLITIICRRIRPN